MSDQYWAAKSGEDFLSEFFKKVEACKQYTGSTPYFRLIQKKRRAYYGQSGAATSFGMRLTGERGELVSIHDNKIREVGTHVLGLMNIDPLGFTAEPLNDDAASQNQAMLVNDFLRAIVESKDLNKMKYSSDERSWLDSEAFIHCGWDPFAGLLLQQDEMTGETFYEGDIFYELLGPDRIIRDLLAPPSEQLWLGTVTEVNKFDLAAKFPQYADDILRLKNDSRPMLNYGMLPATFMQTQASEDFVQLYTFYHKKTPALPKGKYCLALSPKIYLVEGELEYTRIPIIRHSAADVIDSQLGYTPVNDALVHNEILNACKSVQLSNALNHGVRTILGKAGNKFNPQQLSQGNRYLEYNTEAPSILEYPGTPPEIPQLGETSGQEVANKLGQNTISMGQIDSSTRLSYDSMAMAESKASQSIQPLVQSSRRAWTEVAQLTVEIFKLKATAPRIMRMVGESGAYLIEDFSGETLGDVDRIKINMGNALTATPNQRMNIIQMMTQYGLFDDPTDVTEYLLNGKIDRPLKSKMKKAIRIKEHCEMLSRGEIPMVLPTDDHVLFIQHVINGVLNQESSVRNEQVRNACTQYIDQHIQMAMGTPPQMAALFGQTPIPIIAPPGAPSQGAPPEGEPQPEQPPAEAPAEPVAA